MWAWETGNLAGYFCHEGVMGPLGNVPIPTCRTSVYPFGRGWDIARGIVPVPDEMVLALLMNC